MNTISKIRSVGSNPGMFSAYVRWVGSKLIPGGPPRLSLPGGTRLGGWLSFSEYWSFQDIIPKSEHRFVERCVAHKSNSGTTAIDVGANLGAFTCLAASMGCIVHAFEPIPETFCRLKKNVQFNGLLNRCHLNCLAVGRARDLVTFRVQEKSPATNRLARPDERRCAIGMSTQIVAAIDLDEYCQSQNVEFIDFLKVDVEGMEPYVLQGAKELLRTRKISAILIEICPANLKSAGFSPADLYHEFENAHYSPYVLNDDGRLGVKLSLAEIETMSLANVILFPDA